MSRNWNPRGPVPASALRLGDIVQVNRTRRLVVSSTGKPMRGKVPLCFSTLAGYFSTSTNAPVDQRYERVGHDASYDRPRDPSPRAGVHPTSAFVADEEA